MQTLITTFIATKKHVSAFIGVKNANWNYWLSNGSLIFPSRYERVFHVSKGQWQTQLQMYITEIGFVSADFRTLMII